MLPLTMSLRLGSLWCLCLSVVSLGPGARASPVLLVFVFGLSLLKLCTSTSRHLIRRRESEEGNTSLDIIRINSLPVTNLLPIETCGLRNVVYDRKESLHLVFPPLFQLTLYKP